MNVWCHFTQLRIKVTLLSSVQIWNLKQAYCQHRIYISIFLHLHSLPSKRRKGKNTFLHTVPFGGFSPVMRNYAWVEDKLRPTKFTSAGKTITRSKFSPPVYGTLKRSHKKPGLGMTENCCFHTLISERAVVNNLHVYFCFKETFQTVVLWSAPF